MRHCCFYSSRNVDDRLILCRWLPYIKYRITYFHCIIHFCAVETFRTVLEREIPLCLVCQFFQQFCAIDCKLFDLLFALFKYLFALCHRSRIVKVNDCMRRTLDRLKCFLNNMFSRLCQNLYGHIIRDHITLDQCSHENKFCLRSCRETNLNFLESDIH